MVFDVARLRLVFIAPGTPKAGVLVLATVLNYSVGQECPTLSPQVGTLKHHVQPTATTTNDPWSTNPDCQSQTKQRKAILEPWPIDRTVYGVSSPFWPLGFGTVGTRATRAIDNRAQTTYEPYLPLCTGIRAWGCNGGLQ